MGGSLGARATFRLEATVRVLQRRPADLVQTVRRVLGLDLDPEPLLRPAEAQPELVETIRALRGLRPPRFAGVFEAFLQVVPSQQVSLDASVAIVGRVV